MFIGVGTQFSKELDQGCTQRGGAAGTLPLSFPRGDTAPPWNLPPSGNESCSPPPGKMPAAP